MVVIARDLAEDPAETLHTLPGDLLMLLAEPSRGEQRTEQKLAHPYRLSVGHQMGV